MAPGSRQKAHLRLIWSIFGAWPPNGPRRPSEGPFWAFPELGHQMVPGSHQKAHFEHFRALATKWPQEAPRRLILSIFGAWPPNGPGRPQKHHFEHFRSLATQWPQEAPLELPKARLSSFTSRAPKTREQPNYPQDMLPMTLLIISGS